MHMPLAQVTTMHKNVPLAEDALRMSRKNYHICDQLSGKVKWDFFPVCKPLRDLLSSTLKPLCLYAFK